jgi:drug/metabolite transporter (DMT)-like permease
MQDQRAHERTQRLTGIALMCGAVACFAVLDTMAKYLNLHMSTLQVVWARYTGAFLFPFVLSNPWTRPQLTITARPGLQIGRSVLLLGSTLFSLTAAMLYALYSIMTRILARTDSNATTLFYSNIVGAVALVPALPFVWTTPSHPLIIVLMVATGAVGSFGHYLLIAAHRLAPAAVLSPFIYTEIVLVIALGFLVFGDLPTRWTLAGAAIVIGSGLYIFQRERAMRGKK